MNRILVVALSLAAAVGCATSGSAGNTANLTESGTVTGVVGLAEGVTGSCDALKISAANGEATVGKVAVRQSRNRCSFDVTLLPAGAPITVSVNAGALSCANGGAISVSPGSQSVTLKKDEFKTVDFKATCG